jgi:hypothetical protein
VLPRHQREDGRLYSERLAAAAAAALISGGDVERQHIVLARHPEYCLAARVEHRVDQSRAGGRVVHGAVNRQVPVPVRLVGGGANHPRRRARWRAGS